jgi:hypothetical protein
MTPEKLRDIMTYLMDRIQLDKKKGNTSVFINFNTPTEEEMLDAGLDSEGVKRILSASWWEEMVTDIIETPDMCDPEDTPIQVLEYARDVVSEYVRKRFPLEAE